MIRNIKKLFQPKTKLHKKQVLQDPGQLMYACMQHCKVLQAAHTKYTYYIKLPFEALNYNKIENNTLELEILQIMTTLKFTLILWNFPLTVFKLTVHLKH